jgi:hypothetical protein
LHRDRLGKILVRLILPSLTAGSASGKRTGDKKNASNFDQ